jgi:hypothetical protein
MQARNTANTKEMLKAAGFAAAMLAAEYYLFSGGEEHGHHHHHHHYHDDDTYIASVIGKFVGLTAAALVTSGRFVVAGVSQNNSAVIGVGEFALNYFSPGGALAGSAFRGLFGAAVSSAINKVAPNNVAAPEPASTRRPM